MLGQRAAASAQRIFEVLDEQPEIVDRPDAIDLADCRGDVRFDDVVVPLRERHARCSTDLDLHLRPGETVALVGRTGSGKSTIARLLARFYDVTDGAVRIDGHDVRDVTLASLRHQVGIVLDEPFLFSVSIRDNIAYGRPDASLDDVVAAAQRGRRRRLHHASCPTATTPSSASAATRCRAASASASRSPARCCVNPPILVLDDATSAIDVQIEQQIHARAARPDGGPDDAHHRPPARRRSASPTGSWSSTTAASSPRARTPSCWPPSPRYAEVLAQPRRTRGSAPRRSSAPDRARASERLLREPIEADRAACASSRIGDDDPERPADVGGRAHGLGTAGDGLGRRLGRRGQRRPGAGPGPAVRRHPARAAGRRREAARGASRPGPPRTRPSRHRSAPTGRRTSAACCARSAGSSWRRCVLGRGRDALAAGRAVPERRSASTTASSPATWPSSCCGRRRVTLAVGRARDRRGRPARRLTGRSPPRSCTSCASASSRTSSGCRWTSTPREGGRDHDPDDERHRVAAAAVPGRPGPVRGAGLTMLIVTVVLFDYDVELALITLRGRRAVLLACCRCGSGAPPTRLPARPRRHRGRAHRPVREPRRASASSPRSTAQRHNVAAPPRRRRRATATPTTTPAHIARDLRRRHRVVGMVGQAMLLLIGGHMVLRGRADDRRAHRVHPLPQRVLPADPAAGAAVQQLPAGPGGGHQARRAALDARRRSRRRPTPAAAADRGRDRVRRRVVRLRPGDARAARRRPAHPGRRDGRARRADRRRQVDDRQAGHPLLRPDRGPGPDRRARPARRRRSSSLRRQLGVVPQEPFLFAGTMRDNIAFARPTATDAEMLDGGRARSASASSSSACPTASTPGARARRLARRPASAS